MSELRSFINSRLETLNRDLGRDEEWYSDEAENELNNTSFDVYMSRLKRLGLEDTISDYEAQYKSEGSINLGNGIDRLTPWEFRDTRKRLDDHVKSIELFLSKGKRKLSPVVICEAPTGLIDAHVVYHEVSRTYVIFIEEGLYYFSWYMVKLFMLSLPIPEKQEESIEAFVDSHTAKQIINMGNGGMRLRLFEIMCYFLLEGKLRPLEPLPLLWSQSRFADLMFRQMEVFYIAHEYVHTLVGDRSFDDIAHEEFYADFHGGDILAGIMEEKTVNSGVRLMTLWAPILFFEFLHMFESCFLRLAYGREAKIKYHRPEQGYPTASLRSGHLLTMMKMVVDPILFDTVEKLVQNSREICDYLLGPVTNQMHVLWRAGIKPHPKWRASLQEFSKRLG